MSNTSAPRLGDGRVNQLFGYFVDYVHQGNDPVPEGWYIAICLELSNRARGKYKKGSIGRLRHLFTQGMERIADHYEDDELFTGVYGTTGISPRALRRLGFEVFVGETADFRGTVVYMTRARVLERPWRKKLVCESTEPM